MVNMDQMATARSVISGSVYHYGTISLLKLMYNAVGKVRTLLPGTWVPYEVGRMKHGYVGTACYGSVCETREVRIR